VALSGALKVPYARFLVAFDAVKSAMSRNYASCPEATLQVEAVETRKTSKPTVNSDDKEAELEALDRIQSKHADMIVSARCHLPRGDGLRTLDFLSTLRTSSPNPTIISHTRTVLGRRRPSIHTLERRYRMLPVFDAALMLR
jgi:CheY-like chemotaxis protein